MFISPNTKKAKQNLTKHVRTSGCCWKKQNKQSVYLETSTSVCELTFHHWYPLLASINFTIDSFHCSRPLRYIVTILRQIHLNSTTKIIYGIDKLVNDYPRKIEVKKISKEKENSIHLPFCLFYVKQLWSLCDRNQSLLVHFSMTACSERSCMSGISRLLSTEGLYSSCQKTHRWVLYVFQWVCWWENLQMN